MRMPKKASSPKAIQWSYASMRWLKRLAPNHPNRGINAWKKPKKKAIVRNVFQWMRLRMIPLATDTVKQSIARLTANNQISNVLMC